MKYVGNKEENIEYTKRPGAYAIIVKLKDTLKLLQMYILQNLIKKSLRRLKRTILCYG